MPGRRRLLTPRDRPRFDTEYDSAADEPHVASVDDRGRRPPRNPRDEDRDPEPQDEGLFRMLGVLVLVSAVVVALVLPASPIRVIDRDSGDGPAGDGIVAQARDDLPDLPSGLSAISRFYNLNVPAGLEGPQVIEVALRERTTDAKNLAFYAYEGQTWKRLAPASLTGDGKSASGELPYPPRSIAVLRSSAPARSLALIVDGGQTPDPKAVANASLIAVRAATLGRDAKALTITEGALRAVAQVSGGKPVYLTVGAGIDPDGASALLGPDLAATIAAAAKTQSAAGVVVDLGAVPTGQRAALTQFVGDLGARLRADRLGLLVAVPVAGRDGGAYDWKALLGVADGLWLMPRVDPATYHAEVEAALAGARDAGVDLSRVALVVERRSQEVALGHRTLISRHDALALASTIQRQGDGGVGGSATVNLSAPFLTASGGALRWHDAAKAVVFAFVEGTTDHHVWVENRFSAAFRLDLADRHGLGGVVVEQAVADESLADVWEAVTPFVQGTPPKLERPFGPYLVPCWQSPGGGSIEGASECWKQDTAPPSTMWRAPSNAGAYALRLVVSDGVAFVGQEISIRVSPDGRAEPASGATATPTPTPGATGTASPTATRTGTSPTPGPAGPPPGPAGN
jgi:hypothetical protein